jgi:hypothetical protein
VLVEKKEHNMRIIHISGRRNGERYMCSTRNLSYKCSRKRKQDQTWWLKDSLKFGRLERNNGK